MSSERRQTSDTKLFGWIHHTLGDEVVASAPSSPLSHGHKLFTCSLWANQETA